MLVKLSVFLLLFLFLLGCVIVTAKSRLVVKFPNFEKEDDLVSWWPYSLIGDSDSPYYPMLVFRLFANILQYWSLAFCRDWQAWLSSRVDLYDIWHSCKFFLLKLLSGVTETFKLLVGFWHNFLVTVIHNTFPCYPISD